MPLPMAVITEPVSVTSAPGKKVSVPLLVKQLIDGWAVAFVTDVPAGIVKDDPPGHSAACTLMAMPQPRSLPVQTHYCVRSTPLLFTKA